MSIASITNFIRRGAGFVAPAAWTLRPKPSLMVLMYHRVLPAVHPDRLKEQPGMWVAPETLAMHLKLLRRHFEIVDLADWVERRLTGGSLPQRACCITFDDGWRDCHDFAFPLLEASQTPATIFLVSDLIGRNYDFWPSRLCRLLHACDEASEVELPSRLVSILKESAYPLRRSSVASISEAVERVIQACKRLSDAEIITLLDEAYARLPPSNSGTGRSLLDRTEIERMSSSGLIKFGSHTRRHTRLVHGLPAAVLHDEIRGSRVQLEALLGGPVDLFCYPNGDYSPAALVDVRSHYRAAVTTESGWAKLTTDLHLIPRIGIHDDNTRDEQSFLARLTGFL